MPTSQLYLIGVTHRTATFGFRERLALTAESESALAAEFGDVEGLREFVILHTCNRVEFYLVAGGTSAADRVANAYCARQGIAREELDRFGLARAGLDAVAHLLEVVTGLDSQLLGENEIFGQAKRAYAVALERGSSGPVLNRLFQKAFQAAKHARSVTAIAAGQVSVANVAVDLAQSVFGSLADAKVVLIGAGEMGGKAGRAFRSRGARDIQVASRRRERAGSLADELEGSSFDFTERDSALASADIVVCSTSAPAAVISAAAVHASSRGRCGRPLLLIDLAMPRDIEPGAAAVPNTFLYNLDHLAEIAENNRLARLVEASRCRTLLAERQTGIWNSLQSALEPRPAAAAPLPAAASLIVAAAAA